MLVTHGSLEPASVGHAVTVGNFDGVHLGHQAILARLRQVAASRGLVSCVLTFEPHPREFFSTTEAPPRLTPLRQKIDLLAAQGIGRAHVLHFDAVLAAESPDSFSERVLTRGLAARWVLVGRDFRYGSRRAGNVERLASTGARVGMAVDVMPDVEHRVEGVPTRVSSSAVRAALARADFDKASALLGRPYEMSGRVVAGERLGHQLGFPTANMTLSHRPALSGIFAVRAARIEGGDTSPWIDGVASLGYRPTVNRTEKPLLEVHLFDFDENLYGQHLRVRFLHKLRDEAKFDDLGQLRAAIAEDARQARAYLNAS